MSLGRVVAIACGAAILGALAWGGWVVFGRAGQPPVVVVADTTPSTIQTSHITATVFFGARSGDGLVATRVEVPLAPTVAAQGEAILRAALSDPPPGALRVVPRGTRLRAFFIDGRGAAFVDVTSEVRRLHAGGSFGEALTVGALVNAVTANLSAARRVHLLVEGQEADTLAGHVDVARALTQDMSLVVSDKGR
jgi:hypothetical protein